MTKFSEINKNSNVEYIADQIFKLIKQEDKHILNDLDDCLINLISHNSNLAKKFNIIIKLPHINWEPQSFVDMKTQVDLTNTDLAKFMDILIIVDKKIDSEMKNNTSLSESQKENLEHDFSFCVKRILQDSYSLRAVTEMTLISLNQTLKFLVDNKRLDNNPMKKTSLK